MPQATVFPKRSPKDLKSALSALCRLWLDVYQGDERQQQEDLQCVSRFIGRVAPSADAGEETDA